MDANNSELCLLEATPGQQGKGLGREGCRRRCCPCAAATQKRAAATQQQTHTQGQRNEIRRPDEPAFAAQGTPVQVMPNINMQAFTSRRRMMFCFQHGMKFAAAA